MMGSGGLLIGASVIIDGLGGPLASLGRLGLDAIGLQDPIFTVGAVALVLGAVIGRRARRKRPRTVAS
jgi:hypothetical protein